MGVLRHKYPFLSHCDPGLSNIPDLSIPNGSSGSVPGTHTCSSHQDALDLCSDSSLLSLTRTCQVMAPDAILCESSHLRAVQEALSTTFSQVHHKWARAQLLLVLSSAHRIWRSLEPTSTSSPCTFLLQLLHSPV